MSKAFTRENDDVEEEVTFAKAELPSGARNYMTADGAERWRKELAALAGQRQQYEPSGEEDGAREKLRRIQARMQAISQKLAEADVVTSAEGESSEVRFGMSVTIRDADGTEDEYRIVGVDEVELEEDWISWLSPLARALMGRKVGETVCFHAPAGEKSLQIVRLRTAR